MTSEDLKQFFDERPALSGNIIADEAGIGRRTLHYKLTDDPRPITEEQAEKLLPVLKKYGYGDKQRLTALKEEVKDLGYRSIWEDNEEILLVEREELLTLIEEELQ